MMVEGKKGKCERILYKVLDMVSEC
ncbi:hypothetical protein [Bacillus thuringiensis]